MFKQTSFKKIEEKVENIHFDYKVYNCPADSMQDIISKQNIKYLETNEMSEKIDGMYMVDKHKKVIFINSNKTNIGRKNFTIAHELGHHFLNHCQLGEKVECEILERAEYKNNNEDENERKETEANVFAACFLMPKTSVISAMVKVLKMTDREHYGRVYLDNQSCNIKDWNICWRHMQNQFKTSQTCIKWRLYNLDYLHGPELFG